MGCAAKPALRNAFFQGEAMSPEPIRGVDLLTVHEHNATVSWLRRDAGITLLTSAWKAAKSRPRTCQPCLPTGSASARWQTCPGRLAGSSAADTSFPMPMPPYPVYCYTPGCGALALYKIASRWSDGITGELKTYALSCEACLADWFDKSQRKQAACRLAQGESLEPPGIYQLTRGQHDQQLERLNDLEAQLRGSA